MGAFVTRYPFLSFFLPDHHPPRSAILSRVIKSRVNLVLLAVKVVLRIVSDNPKAIILSDITHSNLNVTSIRHFVDGPHAMTAVAVIRPDSLLPPSGTKLIASSANSSRISRLSTLCSPRPLR